MGLLDLFRSKAPTMQTKDPGFVVTNFNKNTNFQDLINSQDKENYFEQYILYTYKCIDLISNSVASQKLSLVDKNEEDVKNQILEDLSHFNNYMTLWEAIKLVQMHLALTGAAFWVMREPENKKHKYDFFPLDPTKVSITTNDFGLPRAYRYEDGNGEYIDFQKDEIVYFRKMDPRNWFEGLSQIQAFGNVTNSFNVGSQYNLNKLNSDGMPDFFLWFEGLTPEEKERAEYQLKSKYMGPNNANRQGVLSTRQKPEVIELSKSQKELDFVAGMKMMRQDVMALFGVPEAMVFPSSTNANTKESVKIYQQQTVKPLLDQLIAALNEQLLPNYFKGNRIAEAVTFIYDDPVDQDRLEQSVIVKNYTEAGFTLNDALRMAGLPEIDGGEIRKIELSSVPVENTESDVKIMKEIDGIKSVLEDTLIKESKETERVRFKATQLEEIITQENRVLNEVNSMFLSQAALVVDSLKGSAPALKNIPKKDALNAVTKDALKGPLQGIMAEANNSGNVEIKQKLLKASDPRFVSYRSKSLSPDIISALEQRLQVFSDELNETTLKKLKEVVSQGVRDELDSTAMSHEIAAVFNNYIDGTANVNTLKKYGVYVDAISVTSEGGVIAGSANRYNNMLELITQMQGKGEITNEVMNELLTSLKGVIDTSDPVGASVDGLLSSIYGVNKKEGITAKRADTIARTESTYARNLGLDATYQGNPFVKAIEWVAIGDTSTRFEHMVADSQITEPGTPFVVGGEKMKFPGDSSQGAGAHNIVNCRCRVLAVV